jgi:nitrate/nitrite transporter NarK
MWLGGGLGVAQLIAWGTIYYAIAVLGEPMQRDLALSRSELYGVFTWSLALSGLLARWAGRLVDRLGGRRVLMAGAVLGALGFSILAIAQSWWS